MFADETSRFVKGARGGDVTAGDQRDGPGAEAVDGDRGGAQARAVGNRAGDLGWGIDRDFRLLPLPQADGQRVAGDQRQLTAGVLDRRAGEFFALFDRRPAVVLAEAPAEQFEGVGEARFVGRRVDVDGDQLDPLLLPEPTMT